MTTACCNRCYAVRHHDCSIYDLCLQDFCDASRMRLSRFDWYPRDPSVSRKPRAQGRSCGRLDSRRLTDFGLVIFAKWQRRICTLVIFHFFLDCKLEFIRYIATKWRKAGAITYTSHQSFTRHDHMEIMIAFKTEILSHVLFSWKLTFMSFFIPFLSHRCTFPECYIWILIGEWNC